MQSCASYFSIFIPYEAFPPSPSFLLSQPSLQQAFPGCDADKSSLRHPTIIPQSSRRGTRFQPRISVCRRLHPDQRLPGFDTRGTSDRSVVLGECTISDVPRTPAPASMPTEKSSSQPVQWPRRSNVVERRRPPVASHCLGSVVCDLSWLSVEFARTRRTVQSPVYHRSPEKFGLRPLATCQRAAGQADRVGALAKLNQPRNRVRHSDQMGSRSLGWRLENGLG